MEVPGTVLALYALSPAARLDVERFGLGQRVKDHIRKSSHKPYFVFFLGNPLILTFVVKLGCFTNVITYDHYMGMSENGVYPQ